MLGLTLIRAQTMDRATLFVLAREMGADDTLAKKVVSFFELGMAVGMTDSPMASPSWFQWAEPFVKINPAAAGMGLIMLGKHYTSLQKDTIAIPLLLKGYEAIYEGSRRQIEKEKGEEEKKKMFLEMEEGKKNLRDWLAKQASEAKTPEYAKLIQTIKEQTLDKKTPQQTQNEEKKKVLAKIEEGEKKLREVMTKGIAETPELEELIESLARGTIARIAIAKAALKK
jgi:hypothetical protein